MNKAAINYLIKKEEQRKNRQELWSTLALAILLVVGLFVYGLIIF